MSDWRPIETAPTGGAWLLLWANGRCVIGGWDQCSWRSASFGKDIDPTHWMPLPAPPSPVKVLVQDDANGIIHRDGKRTYWQRPKA
jgi:hypothetical protein